MGSPGGLGLTAGVSGEVADWIRQIPEVLQAWWDRLGRTHADVRGEIVNGGVGGRALGCWGTTRAFAAL